MATAIVPEKLRIGNYDSWSACMKNYLLAHDLWDLIESPSGAEPPNQQVAEAEYKAWRKKNATALHAIQISCSPFMSPNTDPSTDSAKIAWDNLANSFRKPLPVPKGKAGNIPTSDSDSDFDDFDTDSEFEGDDVTGKVKDDYTLFAGLADSVYRGDWHSTRNFLDRHPGVINAKINSFGRTVLHLATIAGNVEIGGKLVELMSKEALAIQDSDGNTALHYAASQGITKMASYIVEKNDTVVAIANKSQYIPIASACASGHRDTTIYLLSITPLEAISLENGSHGFLLLRHAITSKMLDIALEIFRRCPSFATASAPRAKGKPFHPLPPASGAKGKPFLPLPPAPGAKGKPFLPLPPAPGAKGKPFHPLPPAPGAMGPFYRQTALCALLDASRDLFPSGCQLGFWQRWIYSCMHVRVPLNIGKGVHTHILDQSQHDLKIIMEQVLTKWSRPFINFLQFSGIYELKMNHAYASRLLHCMCEHILTFDQTGVFEASMKAVELGLVEFISEMVEFSPSLQYDRDMNGRNMVMSSILYRQENVFNLFYGLARHNSFVDQYGNTMLHLAGMLLPHPQYSQIPGAVWPSTQLARISGAALQMQRELQWYKEVESIVHPAAKFTRNNMGETPSQVFSKSHKQLVIEGEKWMKSKATCCAVVGAFVITVMFVAALTVPGVNIQDVGIPVFLRKKSFLTFIISDAIALFASSTSVLMFFGILTARYGEEDFLITLPRKLIIGLSTLSISITAMMVAFCAALTIMLNGKLEVIIPIISLAAIPFTLFMFLEFPLLVQIFMSTYGPSIFNKKKKIFKSTYGPSIFNKKKKPLY